MIEDKSRGDISAFLTICLHGAIHGSGTLVVLAICGVEDAVIMGLVDATCHVVVDWIKASPRLGGRWRPSDREFWMALGLDQLLHHLTYVGILWWVLCLSG